MKYVDSMFKIFLLILGADVVIGTISISMVEGLSPLNAFYFTVVTITTVGYGDIAPVTDTGRMIAGVLIITGVAAFTGVVATITERLVFAKEESFRQEKLGIVVSVFFSEIGNALIGELIRYDTRAEKIRDILSIDASWDERRFREALERLREHDYPIRLERRTLRRIFEFIEART